VSLYLYVYCILAAPGARGVLGGIGKGIHAQALTIGWMIAYLIVFVCVKYSWMGHIEMGRGILTYAYPYFMVS